MFEHTLHKPIRVIWERWMQVVDAFSWLFTRITLTLLFFTVFTIYSTILSIMKKDPLGRDLNNESESYWEDYHTINKSLEDFKKQY
jgi:hypothetical protein